MKAIASTIYAFVFLALAWQIASWLLGSERLPGIWQTALSLFESVNHDSLIEAQGGGSAGYLPHIATTLSSFLLGLSFGSLIGFILALAIYQLPTLRTVTNSYLEFFRVLPPLLVIPFTICLFSSLEIIPAITVGIYSAFTICVYVLNALRNIPSNYAILSRFMGSSRFRRVFDVQLPAVMPELLGGLRVASVLGLGIAIVAEYLAAPNGIGRVMKYAMSFSRIDLILDGVIWVCLISLAADFLIAGSMSPMLRSTMRQKMSESD